MSLDYNSETRFGILSSRLIFWTPKWKEGYNFIFDPHCNFTSLVASGRVGMEFLEKWNMSICFHGYRHDKIIRAPRNVSSGTYTLVLMDSGLIVLLSLLFAHVLWGSSYVEFSQGDLVIFKSWKRPTSTAYASIVMNQSNLWLQVYLINMIWFYSWPEQKLRSKSIGHRTRFELLWIKK